MTVPSQVPTRFPSGVSTDNKWGPLGAYGLPNPAFYQTVFDDFYSLTTADGLWTIYTTGTGAAVANVSGDGGQWKFTTSSSGAGTVAIENDVAGFTIPPASYTGTGLTATNFPAKKLFFATRINLTAVSAQTFVAGLINQSATPSTSPTDGIFFTGSSGTNMTVQAYSSSTQTWSVSIPTAAQAPYVAGGWMDLAFHVTRSMDVEMYVGFPMFGWVPQQAAFSSTSTNSATNNTLNPPAGYVAAYRVAVTGAWTPTTAVLTPALVFSGTAQTAYADFIFAAKER
jgi:hypothetical protein